MNQITNLNGRIGDLETQNKALDDRATMLSNNIVQLDAKIATTEQLLATAQTNNAFLATELQKQMAEKAELERKFNDVDAVRGQLSKLRTELFEARRLQWMNAGINPDHQPKGGELLMMRSLPSGSPPVAAKTIVAKTCGALRLECGSRLGRLGSRHPGDAQLAGYRRPGRCACGPVERDERHERRPLTTARNFFCRPPAMPTYEYACKKCGHEFEVLQSMSAKPLGFAPRNFAPKKNGDAAR